MRFKLTIAGPPPAKGRPRFGNGRAYTDAKTLSAEETVRQLWREAGSPRLHGPLGVCVRCHVQRPQSHRTARGELSAQGRRSPLPVNRPDLDNVWKLLVDALNRLAFDDDKQIVQVHAYKHWALYVDGHVPRTEFEVYELEPTEALAA